MEVVAKVVFRANMEEGEASSVCYKFVTGCTFDAFGLPFAVFTLVSPDTGFKIMRLTAHAGIPEQLAALCIQGVL